MKRIKESLQSLSKTQILSIGLLLVILSGFGTAVYINSTSSNSQQETLMKCMCQEISQSDESSDLTLTNVTGEVDCNTRTGSTPIFHLGVVEISKQCSSKQVYVCEAGEKVDEYYRDKGCSYEINTALS